MGRLNYTQNAVLLANLPALATSNGMNNINIIIGLMSACHYCHIFFKLKRKEKYKRISKLVANVATAPSPLFIIVILQLRQAPLEAHLRSL